VNTLKLRSEFNKLQAQTKTLQPENETLRAESVELQKDFDAANVCCKEYEELLSANTRNLA
jgi:hypothetical protein